LQKVARKYMVGTDGGKSIVAAYRMLLGMKVLDKDGISLEGSPDEDENRVDAEPRVLDSKTQLSSILGFLLIQFHCPI
jgi:hypothetical protein